MGKKEPSKGREWEKGRRDILNQAFHELSKALPSYSDGISLSKKTILTQALEHIQELESKKHNCTCINHTFGSDSKENIELQKSPSLIKWILEVVSKIQQLASLLKASGVNPPQQLVSFETPPMLADKLGIDIVSEIEKIGSNNAVKHLQPNKSQSDKKPKEDVKSRQTQGAPVATKFNSSIDSSSLKKGTCGETKGGIIHIQDNKVNSLNSNSNFVGSSPVVVQPSASILPPQIVFASNSSNSPMTSSLPLLVSVTGVKTVNPLIFVQSNVVTPSPSQVYANQRLTSRCGQTRPIQPGPPSKTFKKLKKIPIPSLRQKSVVPHNVISKSRLKPTNIKSEDSSSVTYRDLNVAKNKKSSKTKSLLKIVSRKKTKPIQFAEKLEKASPKSSSNCDSESREPCNRDCSSGHGIGETEVSDAAISVMQSNYGVPEIDKENVALNGGAPKLDCDNSKTSNFTPFSTSTCNIVQEKVDSVSIHEKCNNQDSLQQTVLQDKTSHGIMHTGRETSSSIMEKKDDPIVNKRSAECDAPPGNAKRGRCDSNDETQASITPSSDHATSNIPQHTEEISSNLSSKMAKLDYSISALCAQQQQLMQQSQVSPLHMESTPSKSSESVETETRQLIHESRAQISSLSDPAENRDSQGNCLNAEKSKDLGMSAPDQFLDWSDKSRGKADRSYPNYSIFSNFAVHSNKNSFIPISDIDNYKAIPDSFDASESSFGLPLNSSDISGDIFASLQVPPGGQHPESISPTAAFLLAFPLVSSSKATELLSEDAVCENTDSQSGMKTILQIGNMEGDTPVTKCVSVFSTPSSDATSVVYSTPNVFSHDNLPEVLPKSKSIDSSTDVNFPQKGQNLAISKMHIGHLKTSSSGSSSEISLSKNTEPLESQDGSKQSCQTRSSSVSVDSAFSTLEVQSTIEESNSRIQEKNLAKPSLTSTSVNDNLQKVSLKPSSTIHHPQEVPFLTCHKQQDWPEVTVTSGHSLTDFTTLSNPRTDCAVNFPIPSSIASVTNSSSSGGVGETVTASYRVQPPSNNSILSWSTITVMDNTIANKPHKLAPFQDTFPSTKEQGKHDSSQSASVVLCSNLQSSETSYSQHLRISGMHSSDKASSNVSHFNQGTSINMRISSSTHSYGHGLGLQHKQPSTAPGFGFSTKHTSSVNFSSLDKIAESKRTYQPDGKQTNPVCDVTAVRKSSSTASNLQCSLRQSDLRNENSGLIFTSSSDGKQKMRDVACDQADVMGTSQIQHSKHSGITHCSQNAAGQQVKTSGTSLYSHSTGVTLKETSGPNPIMNIYHGNSEHKQNESLNTICNHNISGAIEQKKNGSQFHQNLPAVLPPKQISSMPSYGMNQNNAAPHFTTNSSETVSNQQHTYKMIGQNSHGKQSNIVPQHQLQQSPVQQDLSQQNCIRPTKDSSSNMMHRPPVNWMTAPDIRSHQHHNGPAFGNSSNMSSTQGILYLPDSESGGSSSLFDSSSNYHCIDITHSGQSFYKGNELHLFGNEGLENIHENSSWSPNKSASSSMLGNMLIPSTLPTLVGDLALGDNSISRPFFPAFSNTNDSVSCTKKSKRVTHPNKRGEKTEDLHASLNQECSGSFLSVSQLVDTSNVAKSRSNSSVKESIPCSTNFSDQNNPLCHATKQISKSVSSNYSTEALLSSTNPQQSNPSSYRKRRNPGTTHYHNNYVPPGAAFHSSNNNALQSQVPQSQFIPDLGGSRTNDYQGTFIPTDSVPSFMITASSKSQRNHSYVCNIPERSTIEEQSSSDRNADNNDPSGTGSSIRQRPVVNSSNAVPPSSSNIMDFGYMNMQPAMLSEELNFPNHHPPPPFLSHHTYNPQEALYPAPRLSMHSHHPSQNNTVQSPSATTLTNFHLSTIFPEINDKVIC